MKGNFDAMIIKGEDKSFWLDEKMLDLAILTGGSFFNSQVGNSIRDITKTIRTAGLKKPNQLACMSFILLTE